MIGFMIIFMCPLLAVYLYNSIVTKKNKGVVEYILEYSYYLVLINYIIILIITFVFNNKESYLNALSFNNTFAVKYLTASLVLSIILPVITYYFKNTIDIKLYIEKRVSSNEKTNKK